MSKVMGHVSELVGAENRERGAAKLWGYVRRLAAAISEGRDAEFAYRQLVSRGVAPDRAARQVLTEVINRS